MITAAKAFLKRHWPALRLREILFAVLLFAAAMPAIEALWLRDYENTLVGQAEGELIAQGAALAATASALWPGANMGPGSGAVAPADRYHPEPSTVDLNTTPILPERPLAPPSHLPPDAVALAVAGRMAPILEATSASTLASVVMLDRNGQVVRGLGFGGDLSGLTEVRSALQGRPATVLRRNGAYRPRYSLEWLSRASAIRLHYARPILVNGQVVGVLLLSRSPRALFRGVYQDLGKLPLGATVIVGLLIGLAGLVSRGVTRPIEALSAATREVAQGRGSIPETPPTAAIEIRALYEDFRGMANAIALRSRYLRDFAAAVSHEFKTPLAGIGGAVELLQDHHQTMTAAERNRFLANIAGDSERLSHLVARLLDLARADMARPEADAITEVSVPASSAAKAFSQPDFVVQVELAANLPRVAVPESSIEAVLATLLENSRQAGASRATITAAPRGAVVVMSVSDDGPGILEADIERLFEPFFTTRRSDGGTGLGLPIARSLIEVHGGAVVIVPSAVGAVFEVTLPVAPT